MSEDFEWHGNYLNYFTEIEEHFQQARATGYARWKNALDRSLDWVED